MLFTDNMMMPAKVEHLYAAETMMNFVYEPEVAATIAAYVNYISPVKGVKEVVEKKDPKLAEQPADLPARRRSRSEAAPVPRAVAEGRADDAGGDGEGHGGLAMLRLSLRRRRQLLPWLFLGPGLLWLIVFFAIPLLNQLNVSLQSGDPEHGLHVHVGLQHLHGRDLGLHDAVPALDRLRGDRDDPVPDHRRSRSPTSRRSRRAASRT